MSAAARGNRGEAGDGVAERPLDVRVLSGSPTDEELAAVIAVLQLTAATPRERPAAAASAPSSEETGWDRARRDLRAPLPSVWSAWP